ncbi:MAG: preprotein translocase subunit TatA [Methanobacteriota archaeon]
MVLTAPAFGGVPAGPELLIILLILLLFAAPVVAVVAVVVLLRLRSDGDDASTVVGADAHDDADAHDAAANAERIAELEVEVERLRRKVDAEADAATDDETFD